MQKLSFRSATIEDCKLILFFIKELAIYERMTNGLSTVFEVEFWWEYEAKGIFTF